MNPRLQEFVLQGNPHLEIGLHASTTKLMDMHMQMKE